MKDDEFDTRHIEANQQFAEFLTKVTSPWQFEMCRRGFGLVALTEDTPPSNNDDERVQEFSVWLHRQGERVGGEGEEEVDDNQEEKWAGTVDGECSNTFTWCVESE